MDKKEKFLIILGIIFISFNLRAPITAVGSVVGMIKTDFSLTSTQAGFITTLPLIAFAFVSPFVAKISKKYTYSKTMTGGLIFILIGILIRSYTNILGLFIGTLFIGIGIAVGNVLIPSIIKLHFKNNVGTMTSIYTSSMCIFAAIGAGLSIPLAKNLGLGWKNSLSFWFLLVILTLIIWTPQHKMKIKSQSINNNKQDEGNNISIWKSPTAWWVTLFMGMQSLIFYSLVAWLPTIIKSKDLGDSFSGVMALVFQLIAIPATLLIPILCDKFENQRGLVILSCFTYIFGMTLLLIGNTKSIITYAVILMSLGMGGTISLSITFISLRSPNALRASELSGMSQSAGYLLAAIGPFVMGFIYDSFKTWTIPIIIFCFLIILTCIFGWFAGNNVLTHKE